MFRKSLIAGALAAAALTLNPGNSSFGQTNSNESIFRRTQIAEVLQVGSDQLTVVMKGRKPQTIKLNQNTKISIDGKAAGIDNVRPGDTVRYVARENDPSTAEMLDVARDPGEEARVARGETPEQAAQNANYRNPAADRDPRNERDGRNEAMPPVALGIAMGDEPGEKGVEVEQVHPGSPADRAGVRQGDVLISLDGKNVEHPKDVRQQLMGKKNGDRLAIVVKRNGKNESLSATLIGREEIFGQGHPGQQFPPQYGQQFGNQGFGNQQFGQFNPTFRPERKAWLGLGLDDTKKGVEVERVYPNGPAARAGFEHDDVITSIDGKKVAKSEDIFAVLDKAQPGGRAEITITRDGKEEKLQVVFGDSSQFHFGQQGNGQGNQDHGHQGADQYAAHHFVPEHDMMLEHHRNMAVQNQRLERLVMELRDEVRELRKELQQIKK